MERKISWQINIISRMTGKPVWYWVAVSAVLFSACTSPTGEWQPRRTVIAGKVENLFDHSTALLVNFCDPLSEKRRFAQDLTVSGGTFHVAHDYAFAQNLTIRYNNSFINLYVAPGDSVFLTIDGQKLQQQQDDAVLFSGDKAQINEQLFRWTCYAYKLPIPEFDPSASPTEYLQSIRQCFNAMQDTIDAFAQRNPMNEFMKRWAFTDYKFVVANQLQDYKDRKSRWKVFTDPIFDICNEDNFQTMYYPYHLSACGSALLAEIRDMQEELQLQEDDYAAILRVLMKKLSERTPEGAARDMILYLSIYPILEEHPELYDAVPELQSFFSQPVFGETLERSVRKQMADTKQEIASTGNATEGILYFDKDSLVTLPAIELMPYLLERYKNKVLYIDVWATWCGPCLEEMKHTPALHTLFAGKEVVFVNLCLESTVENWRKIVNRQTDQSENYYLDENASKIFMGAHAVKGFPTYMLIDREGRIHDLVARPSNMSPLVKLINSCLEK
ncbi:MAG: TlpA family protein disulfide reductase [Tannerella sp.]|jgi:thiol-disulfide isomerase/thioredoxin|nr:TlpA family protein disulfide reductase [Tannerella sp.]